eukprot:2388522-Amphidinium_carterae.1
MRSSNRGHLEHQRAGGNVTIHWCLQLSNVPLKICRASGRFGHDPHDYETPGSFVQDAESCWATSPLLVALRLH